MILHFKYPVWNRRDKCSTRVPDLVTTVYHNPVINNFSSLLNRLPLTGVSEIESFNQGLRPTRDDSGLRNNLCVKGLVVGTCQTKVNKPHLDSLDIKINCRVRKTCVGHGPDYPPLMRVSFTMTFVLK